MKQFLDGLVALVPFLEPYPPWVKGLLCFWALVTLGLLLSLLLARPPATPATGATGPTPSPSTADSPASSQGNPTERLRSDYALRALALLEAGLPLSRIPCGTYGYASSSDVERWCLGGDPEVVAEQGLGNIEVHKRADGSCFVLLFVSQDSALGLNTGDGATHIAGFAAPNDTASEMVAVRLERLAWCASRRTGVGWALEADVNPEALAAAEGTALQGLRQQHGVRLLTGDEEDLPLASLPRGVYGYAYYGREPASLTRRCVWCVFEVHKPRSGPAVVVAYATAGDAGRAEADGACKVTLFSAPSVAAEATTRVLVPLGRVKEWRGRQLEHRPLVADASLGPLK